MPLTNKFRFVFLALITALLAGGLLAGCTPDVAGQAGAADTAVTPGTIIVIGRGEASGRPDEAHLNVGVDIFAESVQDATAQNDEAIQSILAALSEQQIAEEDIQTSNYNVWAEQRYGENGPEGIAGYRVSNQVNVTVRDIERVGDVLTAVIDAGANSIYGIYFSVADPAALEADAREIAIEDARRRAESLAALSGVTLGEVVGVSEVIGSGAVPMWGMGGGAYGPAMAEAGATSISPGQLDYQVQVQVTFAIGQ